MAKLPTGRYVIVDDGDDGYSTGSKADSDRMRLDIKAGLYPNGAVLMHVVTGKCFKIEIAPRAVAFKSLTTRQRARAERYRKAWWPNPGKRPRPRMRK